MLYWFVYYVPWFHFYYVLQNKKINYRLRTGVLGSLFLYIDLLESIVN